MALPTDSPARQLAETLVAQQETALTELGLELGGQYQVSHTEQAQLATETANNAVSDQAAGELIRLVQEESIFSCGSNQPINKPISKEFDDYQEAALDNLSRSDRMAAEGI